MEDTTNDVLFNDVLFYDEITSQFFTYNDIEEFLRRAVIIENDIGNEDLTDVISGKRIIKIIRKGLT